MSLELPPVTYAVIINVLLMVVYRFLWILNNLSFPEDKQSNTNLLPQVEGFPSLVSSEKDLWHSHTRRERIRISIEMSFTYLIFRCDKCSRFRFHLRNMLKH